MARNESKGGPLPKKIDDLVEFFENNDMGEYWDGMPEAHFEVEIKKRNHLIVIDKNMAARTTAIAKAKKTSSESLVNSWLKEGIRKAS